jgi:hypothetical protein
MTWRWTRHNNNNNTSNNTTEVEHANLNEKHTRTKQKLWNEGAIQQATTRTTTTTTTTSGDDAEATTQFL